MIVLDTNVVSELMRQKPAPAVISWRRDQNGPELFATAITVGEVRLSQTFTRAEPLNNQVIDPRGQRGS